MRTNRPTAAAALIATAACFLLAAIGHAADNDIPKRPPFTQYASLLEKNPFAVATHAVEQQAPPFAKDLYLANAAKVPGGDMITVHSAVDRGMKEYLTTKGPNDHGYSIVSIDWSERPAETKATISKDGQVATIGFNEALMSQAPQPATPNNPIAPGQPQVPGPAYNPPRGPYPAGGPIPPGAPHTRGPIQRNPLPRPTSQ